MRGFIKLCGAAFVLLGMITMVLAMVAALLVFATGRSGDIAALAGVVGLGVVVSGFFGGAAVAMVGGAAYLLASIDERLEWAAKRPS